MKTCCFDYCDKEEWSRTLCRPHYYEYITKGKDNCRARFPDGRRLNNRKNTDDEVELVRKLHDYGVMPKQIAEILNIPYNTIQGYVYYTDRTGVEL